MTPIRSFARKATRDTGTHGQRIAAGVLYASGNRDEEVFGPTADMFDVRRPVDTMHAAFGFGEHFCLGASLARLEARVLFEELLDHFPDFSVAGEIVPPRSTLMNGLVRMPVTFGGR